MIHLPMKSKKVQTKTNVSFKKNVFLQKKKKKLVMILSKPKTGWNKQQQLKHYVMNGNCQITYTTKSYTKI